MGGEGLKETLRGRRYLLEVATNFRKVERGEAWLREHFPNEEYRQWKPRKVTSLLGYGRGRALEGVSHATVLGWGAIAADEVLQFVFPVPPCISAKTGRRRFTVTLAWFSPINPSNRRYRVAKLGLSFPASPDDIVAKDSCLEVGKQVGKGTVQHEVFEGRALRGIVDDDFIVEVECVSEAGLMTAPVRFGLAVTLEGEEAVFPELREQVRERLQIQTQIQV